MNERLLDADIVLLRNTTREVDRQITTSPAEASPILGESEQLCVQFSLLFKLGGEEWDKPRGGFDRGRCRTGLMKAHRFANGRL